MRVYGERNTHSSTHRSRRAMPVCHTKHWSVLNIQCNPTFCHVTVWLEEHFKCSRSFLLLHSSSPFMQAATWFLINTQSTVSELTEPTQSTVQQCALCSLSSVASNNPIPQQHLSCSSVYHSRVLFPFPWS